MPNASVTANEIEIPRELGRVILNTGTGSGFSGAPPARPTELQVDWVRVDPH